MYVLVFFWPQPSVVFVACVASPDLVDLVVESYRGVLHASIYRDGTSDAYCGGIVPVRHEKSWWSVKFHDGVFGRCLLSTVFGRVVWRVRVFLTVVWLKPCYKRFLSRQVSVLGLFVLMVSPRGFSWTAVSTKGGFKRSLWFCDNETRFPRA